VGSFKVKENLDAREVAAWANVASLILISTKPHKELVEVEPDEPLREHELLLTRRQFLPTGSGNRLGRLGFTAHPGLLAGAESSENSYPLAQAHFTPRANGSSTCSWPAAFADRSPRLQPTLEKPSQSGTARLGPAMGQRLTGMTSGQSSFPVGKSALQFAHKEKCGAWISELLPHTSKIVDDICILKTVNRRRSITIRSSRSFRRDSAAGRPAPARASYGLGAPTKSARVHRDDPNGKESDQPLIHPALGLGLSPSEHQGVQFRGWAIRCCFLSKTRRRHPRKPPPPVDGMALPNAKQFKHFADPEITRACQYEMTLPMQTSVPDLVDLSKESASTLEMYGSRREEARFVCLQLPAGPAMAERTCVFIQLLHRGWDQHNTLPKRIREQCGDTDQPAPRSSRISSSALLDDTLVIWGGEFGRTVYIQGKIEKTTTAAIITDVFLDLDGRGGVKPGISYGTTDDYCYNVVETRPYSRSQCHHPALLGLDHER